MRLTLLTTRLTLPHYYAFGDDLPEGELDNPVAWDHLRTQTSGPFAIAEDRQALTEMLTRQPQIVARAEAISALVEGSLASYGAGAGLLEASLNVPRLVVTDSAAATVERLASLLPAAEVVRHDLRADAPLGADMHLFHRVDTEFTNRQWRDIFRAFAGQRIVFVPGGVQPVRVMLMEVAQRLRKRGSYTRAGLFRTRAATEALWRDTHDGEHVWLHDSEGWLLEPH